MYYVIIFLFVRIFILKNIMHKSFIITEEERNRILSNHINATNNQYLNEAMIKGKEFLAYKNNQNVVVDVNNKTLRVANQEEYNQYMNDFQSFGTAGTLFKKMKSQVAQKNPNVEKVQNKLIGLGHKLKPDGVLGPITLKAIYTSLTTI